MLPKEYLDSWNELCAECTMVEADLGNPSETWLTKILISYLRMFGYKVEIPNAEDGTRERRLYLIKLVRQIDHIYKITDKTFIFTYYDLLKPTPRKTSHMLRILLNYLYYFNMFKTNVFKMAADRLKDRQNLIEEVKCTIAENEIRRIKAEKIHEEVTYFSKQVPLQKNELKSLNSQIKHRMGQLQQMEDAIKDLKLKIDELKGQIRILRRLIVPEDQGQELQTQLSKLHEYISESKQQTRNAESNLKTHIVDNNRLLELLKSVEFAAEVLSSDFVESFNETTKQLITTETKAANYEKEKYKKSQMVIRQQNAVETLNEKMKLEHAQYNEEKRNRHQTIIYKTKEKEVLGKQADTLKVEILATGSAINDQQEIHSYIQKQIATLMEPYK